MTTACTHQQTTGIVLENLDTTAVPQIYIRDMVSSTVKPLMALAAFGKVELKSGETKRITLTVSPQSMRTMGVDKIADRNVDDRPCGACLRSVYAERSHEGRVPDRDFLSADLRLDSHPGRLFRPRHL